MKLVEGSVQQEQATGHLCVALPFRPGMSSQLRDNRAQAAQRLRSLQRKFDARPEFKKDYVGFVQKMIDAGHVERVPEEQVRAPASGTVVNYIPHHGVYHPRKHKIRVVFNCASKYHGLSLNDCLLSGPDLTNSIVGVLCRFRQYQIPFVADIEAMFYQVLVPEQQRDCLRFLWEEEGRIATYRMKVHLFGATSSPSVANYALRRAASGAPPTVRNTVLRNFYVDDCLKSVDTKEEDVKLANSLVEVCKTGGFRLTKFMSSDIDFLRCMNRNELAKELEEISLSDDKSDPLGSLQEQALGVVWNVKMDCLGFQVQAQRDSKATKRSILSRISQIYDPLGMAAPVVIVARALFRDLTKNGQDWDECLFDEDARRWKSWQERLIHLQNVKVERWMKLTSVNERYQLHVFCDASTKAYAASVYLRRSPNTQLEETPECQSPNVPVAFVFGKARVAPPKVVTIPRLELTAAKLAAELAYSMKQELEVEIESTILWSDSQTVLRYIKNKTKRFHVFVANRVEAILTKTSPDDWRYIPTHLNPADEATRGLDAEALNGSSWLRGPKFLAEPEALWPGNDELDPEVTNEDPEVKTTTETVQYTQGEENESFIENMAGRYSTALKFRRALAVWLRLKDRLLHKQSKSGSFQAEELHEAENAGIKWLQAERWSQDMEAVQQGRVVPWLRQLAPKVRFNMLLMQCRTGTSLPIIPNGQLAKLLVREAHASGGHMGRQMSMAIARRRYWIVNLSQITRAVVKQCPLCQRRRASLGSTQMSDLPDSRLTPGPPFHTTGIDFFGPFYVRNVRAVRKAYGVIFSCAVSRAIHLELADSLDVSSFTNALRRFCSRRGPVSTIIADNATNLKGACTDLQREMATAIEKHQRDPRVIAVLRELEVEWHFTPPAASHFGGFYERLIRSVREVLTALMDARLDRPPLTTDMLTTLLCECEGILNSRPLTTVSSDPNDLEALTPNHLLLGRAGGAPLPGDYDDLSKALRRRWKFVQHLTTEFWQRWSKEYKTLLYTRKKWFEKERPFRIDDVVLLKDQKTKLVRTLGQLGRIVDVHPSLDGEVRVVDVLTSKGVLTRPITKVCVL